MATITHYTAYHPRPFRRAERERVTVLFGGLTWKHERLIQGALENLHYNALPLSNISRPDLDAGKEMTDVGACCPTTFTTGNLVNFLRSELAARGKQEVMDRYVFITAGACGPCRFGQYHQSYELALDSLGLRDFRMFLLAQDQLDQGAADGGGLEINPPLSMGVIWAILIGDLLTDLEYLTRPYEVTPGETDRVLKESVELLYHAFRNRPTRGKKWGAIGWHVLTRYFTNTLAEVRKRWDGIIVDRLQVKPKVKITGEFWLQTHEGEGNYNIKQWLEQESAELIPPPVAVWLDYLMHQPLWSLEKRRAIDKKAARKIMLLRGLAWLYRSVYDRMRQALGSLPYELPDQDELKQLASPYYYFELDGGEGHMLVGKALHTYLHKKAHMVCELSPYACMPNTMSIGAMANVLGKYPDLLYAPIEIKGDAEIHALSRCQMILTEAKQRAQAEFDETLAKTGLSLEAVRQYEARHPEVTRATYRLAHHGYAGTAANYLAQLSAAGLKPN